MLVKASFRPSPSHHHVFFGGLNEPFPWHRRLRRHGLRRGAAAEDFILQAVQKNGEVLRYACGWHSEPEVVLTAIEKAMVKCRCCG